MSRRKLKTSDLALQSLTVATVSAAPPCGLFSRPVDDNNGAQFPSASPCTSKIDFLDFRLPAGFSWSRCASSILGIPSEQFTALDFGMKGYPCAEQFGSIFICHDPHRPDRGLKVLLSSQALDQCAVDALDILKHVVTLGGHATRIDLALDDRTGLLNYEDLRTACFGGLVVSHFHDCMPTERYDLVTGERRPGGTFYFGSSKSNRFAYFYDKQQERIFAGEVDPGHWIRFEIRCKKTAALAMSDALLSYGLERAPEILRGVIDFREKKDGQSQRREPCGWWLNWLSTCERIKTGFSKVPRTIYEKARWVSRQCKKTIAQVAVILGAEHLAKVVQQGYELTPRSEWLRLWPDYNEAQYKPHQVRFDLPGLLAYNEDNPFPAAAVPF